MTDGTKANRTGNRLERFVEQTLQEYGYAAIINDKKGAFANRKSIGDKRYMTQVPVGPTIYESRRKSDFLIIDKDRFPDGLIIECKWQQAAGSVNEKYPFLLLNIQRTGIPTIVLLDGDGYKPAARRWLADQVRPDSLLRGVWNMGEFQRAVNNGFLTRGGFSHTKDAQ